MAKLLPGSGERGLLRALFGGTPRTSKLGAAEARARLEGLAQGARTRDYFEVLGLPRSCSGEEARLAADALSASVERDLAADRADPSLAPLLADVRQVVLDAREVLGDDALRILYREGLDPEASSAVANENRER